MPNWPVAAAELAGEAPMGVPVVVCGNRGVISVNSWAEREGVTVGMGKRLAHSMCPEAVVLPPDLERDARRFEPVLRVLDQHIARVTVLEPGRVIFAAWGAVRSTGSTQVLAEAITGGIADGVGCEAQVGFAYGTLATLLAAQESLAIPANEVLGYLDMQRTSTLLLAVSTPNARAEVSNCIELLDRLGVRSLKDIRELGRTPLATRFGATGIFVWQLASGESVGGADTSKATPEFSFARAFEPPLGNAEQAAFAAKELAGELAEEMLSRSLAGGRLTITASLVGGEELQRSWALDGGGIKDVVDRVRWQLGSWVNGAQGGAGSGGVSAKGCGAAREGSAGAADEYGRGEENAVARLELSMTDLVAAGARQQPLWGGKTIHTEQAQRAAVRLQSLLGEDAVRVPEKKGGRTPREKYVDRAWNEAEGSSAAAELPWPGAIPEPGPSLIHPKPVAVDVYADCGHPLIVTGDGMLACRMGCKESEPRPQAVGRLGRSFVVVDYAGPWVVEQRWWADYQRRAYLQVVGFESALLLYVEAGQWREEGRYV
ncbi:MAG: DNA polymerase Y family protein [Ancrocorticia sp.]